MKLAKPRITWRVATQARKRAEGTRGTCPGPVPFDATEDEEGMEPDGDRGQGVQYQGVDRAVVPEPRAQDDLAVNEREHHRRGPEEPSRIVNWLGRAKPVPAGQHAEGNHQAEERLAGATVDGRQKRRDLGDAGTAKNSLDDHCDKGDDSDHLHPASRFERE